MRNQRLLIPKPMSFLVRLFMGLWLYCLSSEPIQLSERWDGLWATNNRNHLLSTFWCFFFSSWLNMWFRYRRELFIYHSEYVTLETVSRLLTCCILDKHTANQCLAILEQVKKHRLTACLWKVWSLIRAGW